MSERWIKATKYVSHSQGVAPDETHDILINMSHVGAMFPAKMGDSANPVDVTSLEVDQDYINVIEPITHFLPSEGGT